MWPGRDVVLMWPGKIHVPNVAGGEIWFLMGPKERHGPNVPG